MILKRLLCGLVEGLSKRQLKISIRGVPRTVFSISLEDLKLQCLQ